MSRQAQEIESHLDPYAALGCAVLSQAILDSRRPGLAGEDARAFLRGKDFLWWAESLGLDAAVLTERIGKAVA